MKIFYIIASVLFVFYISAVPVSGQTATPNPTPVRSVTPTISSEQRQVDRERRRLEDRRQRAILRINRTQTNLNSLINKISTNPDLTDEQKRRLIANIQAESARIRALEGDVRSARDLATIEELEDRMDEIEENAKDLYSGVVRQLENINELREEIRELETGADRIAGAISEARGRGQNVAGFEATLSDMRNKINEARNRINAAENTLLSLRPVNEAADDAALENARAEVRSADQLLNGARRDGRAVVRELVRMYRDFFDL